MFEEYLLSFHREDLLEILANQDDSRHFSININFIELHERKIELARALLSDPDISLEEWDKAAVSAQLALSKQLDNKYLLKIRVHCRIYYLAHLARRSSVFPGNKDAGKFLQISGTVMRISAVKLLEYQRHYICTKCKTPTLVKADYNRKYMIKQPKQCHNPEGCSGTNLVQFGDLDSDNCKDYQEIKLQEQVKKLGIGSIPNTIQVTLEDDLVDSCQPGDDVTICGIVRRQFGEFSLGKRTDISLVFKANHVQVDTNSSSFSITTPEIKNMFNSFWEKYSKNPLEGRDVILKSFCPQIYGLYPVKLAIAVVLAGGCPTEDVTLTGVRTRSESHLLMVGDPGTGKSHLLKFASKITPRAVLTTGVGSTAAGLTVTALMENGEWQLEAGALVMSDGGICCIDEFNSMKERDRTTIHEAMEQQTISVAKATMVCKLNTRCSILAACNPKGNIDITQPLSMNVALPSPLLSRFDLIMLLRDTVNQEWDEQVIDYILNDGSSVSKLTDFGLWSISILQSYFKLVKKFQPKLTEDAELILSTYYNIQRRMESRNKARTTVRLLESLVRLSQGHARLMYHEKVLVIDSIYAVYLIETATDQESSILNLNLCSNVVFPEKPQAEYRHLAETILNKLQLFQILDKELNSMETRGGNLQSRFFANVDGNAVEVAPIDESARQIDTERPGNDSDRNTDNGNHQVLPSQQNRSPDSNRENVTKEISDDTSRNNNKNQSDNIFQSEVDPVLDLNIPGSSSATGQKKAVNNANQSAVGDNEVKKTRKRSPKVTNEKGKKPRQREVCNKVAPIYESTPQIDTERPGNYSDRINDNENYNVLTSQQFRHPTNYDEQISENTSENMNKHESDNIFQSEDDPVFDLNIPGSTGRRNSINNANRNTANDEEVKGKRKRSPKVTDEKDKKPRQQEVSDEVAPIDESVRQIDTERPRNDSDRNTYHGNHQVLTSQQFRPPDSSTNYDEQISGDTNENINRNESDNIFQSEVDPVFDLNIPEVSFVNGRKKYINNANQSAASDDEVKKTGKDTGRKMSTITVNQSATGDNEVKKTRKRSPKVTDKKDKKSRKRKVSDGVINDLEMLELIPGVNDDLEVDFDMDWENSTTVDGGDSSKVDSERKDYPNIFSSSDDVDFNICI